MIFQFQFKLVELPVVIFDTAECAEIFDTINRVKGWVSNVFARFVLDIGADYEYTTNAKMCNFISQAVM